MRAAGVGRFCVGVLPILCDYFDVSFGYGCSWYVGVVFLLNRLCEKQIVVKHERAMSAVDKWAKGDILLSRMLGRVCLFL